MYVLKRVAAGMALAAAGVLIVACGSSTSGFSKPSGFSRMPVLMSGTGGFGTYDIRLEGTNTVVGTGPWGDFGMYKSRIGRNGTPLLGTTADWGQVSLIWSGRHVSGSAGAGTISADITFANKVPRLTGTTQWGSFSLTLRGQTLTGNLPFGSANFHVARDLVLTDPRLLMPILLVLSGEE